MNALKKLIWLLRAASEWRYQISPADADTIKTTVLYVRHIYWRLNAVSRQQLCELLPDYDSLYKCSSFVDSFLQPKGTTKLLSVSPGKVCTVLLVLIENIKLNLWARILLITTRIRFKRYYATQLQCSYQLFFKETKLINLKK